MVEHVVRDLQGNRHRIYVDEDLIWLIPYLSVAKRKGIPVWRVKRIKGYSVPKGKIEIQKAQISQGDDSTKFIITILKQKQILKGDGRRVRVVDYSDIGDKYEVEDALQVFAHELAHLVEWDHTPDHLILLARLFLSFVRFAKKSGYKGYK